MDGTCSHRHGGAATRSSFGCLHCSVCALLFSNPSNCGKLLAWRFCKATQPYRVLRGISKALASTEINFWAKTYDVNFVLLLAENCLRLLHTALRLQALDRRIACFCSFLLKASQGYAVRTIQFDETGSPSQQICDEAVLRYLCPVIAPSSKATMTSAILSSS